MNVLQIVALSVGAPLLILGIVFLFIGLKLFPSTKHWLRTSALIVKKDNLLMHFPDRYPTFFYEVDGTTFQKTSTVHQQPGFKPDTIVEILYNPDDPQQAVIDSVAQRGTVFTIIGESLLIIALLFLLGTLPVAFLLS